MASNFLISINGTTVTLSIDANGNGNYESVSVIDVLNPAASTMTVDPDDNPATNNSFTVALPLCFMQGTMIATESGEKAIESLEPGELVRCSDGRLLPVRWIGRQTISRQFTASERATPILIRAHALSEGVPCRDLLVSASHALYVDGVLAHAGALVNGVSIMRYTEAPETFCYYNVELPEHALILAENTAAESFVDNASREHFDNWSEREALGSPEPIREMDLPRAKSYRQVPASVHEALLQRARALGWLQTAEAA